MARIIKVNYYLVSLLLIAHILMLSLAFMSKEFLLKYVDYMVTFIFIMMALLGFYLANMAAKMEKSLYSGWPTPWNVKSELAWEKSQRFVGFSLTGVAILTMISAFIWSFFDMIFLAPTVFLLGGLLSYAGCFIVSYYVYQQEQHYKNSQQTNDENR